MKKGIIMEIKHDYAIILSDDGEMEKIINRKNMNVGQKIYYFDEDILKINNVIKFNANIFMKSVGCLAALFLFAFTFFYRASYDESIYAVVSLDINPSIQIEVDSNQNILNVKGMNDDGKKLTFTDVEGSNLNNGIKKIKNELAENNYLKNNRDVLVGFALRNDDKDTVDEDTVYEDNVIGAITTTFDSQTVTYVKGKSKDIDDAKTKGISLGRYEAVQVADDSQIEKAPVKEITERIKDKKNVVQWKEKDKKNDTVKIPEAEIVDDVNKDNIKDNIKDEVEKGDEDSKSQTNTKVEKPLIDISDKPSIDKDNDGIPVDNEVEKPKDDDVIIIEPDEKPSDNNDDTSTTEPINPPDDQDKPDNSEDKNDQDKPEDSNNSEDKNNQDKPKDSDNSEDKNVVDDSNGTINDKTDIKVEK